ncbi:MAG: type IX secretion system sortase PorU [Muribaculaceae bacterium]|nr:type IX secretion system sortase PorU [Muribaculaceae bacterium]
MIKPTELLKRCFATMVCCTIAAGAHALPASHFATSSKLASGRWVKIAIPADGVYEITAAQLKEMGFADINNVQVYGNGGHMLSEVLTDDLPDDLNPVASIITDGKLCFYACGPVDIKLNTATTPSFARVINPYSTMGYYFLTEGQPTAPLQAVNTPNPSATTVSTSYGYAYHEVDQFSFSMSGKVLMGEDITNGASFDINMPNVASNTLTLNMETGVKLIGGKGVLDAHFITDTENVKLTLNKADATPVDATYYTECTPSGSFTLNAPKDSGKLTLLYTNTGGSIAHARLDYYLFTYIHHNSMAGIEDSQLCMAFNEFTGTERIVIPQAPTGTVVWNIDNPTTPVAYKAIEGENGYEIYPSQSESASYWVAFNPNGKLKQIAGYEAVANQDLHSMQVPDMLIITNKALMSQAQRVAQMHQQHDGMDVAVVDQDDIFNEFSSGTPDVMAYRLMCKMLYDRNSSKFKYLLLLGAGSYDNRGLATNKSNRILTYQTNNSYSENSSYTSDDFFGFLGDNSGRSVNDSKLHIGVGRIPSATPAEAASDVDKLINYVLSPDYGPWRNNIFISAEFKDEKNPDLHQSQAELLSDLIDKEIGTGMAIDKAYVNMYPTAVNEGILSEHSRTSVEANRHFAEALKRGQFFGTYVGHAGPRNFTVSRMWTSQDVFSTNYDRLPIFTTACCDVARYDDDTRGIAEQMFHKKNGGAIALLTSTRQVLSTSNDNLNRAFVSAMFDWKPNTPFPTLGDITFKAKTSMTNAANHMKFVLLGDPAMRIFYPLPLFEITEVNGVKTADNTTVKLNALGQVTVKAQVLKPDRSGINTDFNGDATITIYDTERHFKYASETFTSYKTDIYYPREILTQVQGRVVNGIFTGTAVLPRYSRSVGNDGLIRVYAHQDNSSNMVNGHFDNIMINGVDEDAPAHTEAPVITSMFLNEETSFTSGAVVPANSTLYIRATDDLAINNQSLSMGNNMRLVLDGNTSFYTVGNYATVSNEGRTLDIAFPLEGLSEGEHSLTYVVHDVAGNAASRTISFFVRETGMLNIKVDELPATTQATIQASTALTSPTVDVKVTDALGNLVWNTTTSSFPVVWNLKDNYNRKVAGGRYKVYGTFTDGTVTGGTNVADVLVITPSKKPVKK